MRPTSYIPVVFFVLFITGLVVYVFYHEDSHRAILERTGYENVTISIDMYGGVHTYGSPGKFAEYDVRRQYTLYTEIIGYHMIGFIANLWLMVLFLVVSLLVIFRGRDHACTHGCSVQQTNY